MAISIKAVLQAGQRHQHAGQFQDAKACYQHVLSLVPGQPAALYLMGTLAQQMGHLEDAIQLMRSAIASDPKQSRFYVHLGSILIAQIKIEEALELLRSATRQLPLNAELQDGLGVLLQMKGLAAESLHAYQRAVSLDPQLLQPHLHLAVCHIQQGQPEEAVKECRCALQIQPHSVEARRFLASALMKQGQPEAAIASLLAAQALDPKHGKIAIELAQAYLIAGNPRAALESARQGLISKKGNTALLAYQYYALWELGVEDEAMAILDLHHLIFQETLAPPAEYPTLEAFHADFKAELVTHPTLTWEPAGKTTRHGYQSGNLEEISLPLTDLFMRHLRQNVEAFLARLPEEPQHPFFGNKPAEYRLHAWATILEAGGHQEPHFHASGWLSGVYYLAMPPEIATDTQAGWIEFGRRPNMIPMRREPPVRTLQPEVGKLVLFPSYTYHRTLPFGGTGKRISIAFDVMPSDSPVNHVPYTAARETSPQHA